MTPNEVAARLQEVDQQHPHLDYYEDISIIVLMVAILVYIVIMSYFDNRRKGQRTE